MSEVAGEDDIQRQARRPRGAEVALAMRPGRGADQQRVREERHEHLQVVNQHVEGHGAGRVDLEERGHGDHAREAPATVQLQREHARSVVLHPWTTSSCS